jgi:hypothetical protein
VVAQQEVQVEVKYHLRAGDFERASFYTQSRQDSEPGCQANNASQCPSTMRQLPGRRSSLHGKRHFLERGERTWTAVPSATRGSGETGPLLLCKFAEGHMCRCDEVMCYEVSEAALRRKHDGVPRLARLVEQQGERVRVTD